MTQLPLFDGSDLLAHPARRTDPQTSHDAAERMQKTGALSRQRQAVLDAIAKWPNQTPRELSALSGLDYFLIQRRVSELEKLGHIARAGTRDGQTVWRVK